MPPATTPAPPRVPSKSVVSTLLLKGFLREGRELAEETADRLKLGKAFRAGELTAAQSRRLARVVRLDAEARFRAHTARLVEGKIELAAWQKAFQRDLVRADGAAVLALHRGGPLTLDQQKAYQRAVNKQAGYLQRFRNEVASGEQLLDGTAVARAGLYGAATWGVANRVEQEGKGHAEEKWALGPLDHCRDCLTNSNGGWQPAGTYTIGATVCKARCGCHLIYRGGALAAKPKATKAPKTVAAGAGDDDDFLIDFSSLIAAPKVPLRPLKPPAKKTPVSPPSPPPLPPSSVPPTREGFRSLLFDPATGNLRSVPDQKRAIATHLDAASSPPAPVKFHGMTEPEALRSFVFDGVTYRFPSTARPAYGGLPEAPAKGAIVEHIYEIVLRRDAFPAELTRHTREVVYSSQKNASDAHWERAYGMKDFTSAATAGDGRMVVYEGRDVGVPTFVHELGHNLATGRYGGSSPRAGSDYARAIASDEPPVSEYGSKSPSEDFAESVKFYMTAREAMARDAPRRHAIIGRLLEDPGYGG